MRFIGVTIVVFLKILCVLSRMLPIDYMIRHRAPMSDTLGTTEKGENSNEKVVELRTSYDGGSGDDPDDFADYDRKLQTDLTKKQCGVVVLSRMPNANMQSLLRKYRYDANGVLIPSSVKYFIKLPQGLKPPLLVPLNEKSFSPLGGFVRYYKEVPPIPHSW